MEITQISPSPEQMKALLNYPKNTALVMVNIVKFKAKSGVGNETGQQTYARYFKDVQPFVKKAGVKLIWSGNVATTVIGDSTDQPDIIFLAEYPSVDHFLALVTNPDYQKVAQTRSIAIKYGGLIACTTS